MLLKLRSISFYFVIPFDGAIRRLFNLLILAACTIQPTTSLRGQSLPDVPHDMNFAGVSVHLTQSSWLQVQQEVQLMYMHRDRIQADMNTLQQFTTLVKPLFKEADLPDDFRYVGLPFTDIDSLGFWALSSTQARALRLRIDDTVDERYHPILSTEAVLADFARLQKTQSNYVLTLLAYLKGDPSPSAPDRIDPTYIQIDHQSPLLLWKILARKLVFDHEALTYHPPTNYVLYEYQNGEGKTLQTIAEHLQVPKERINPLNQWLKAADVPTGKEYTVLIQVRPDEFSVVRSRAHSDLGRQSDVGFPIVLKMEEQAEGLRSLAIFYKINERRGVQAQNCDNFITLAFYGNITINAFLKINDLSKQDIARPGEIYYLQRKAKRAKVPFHVVQKNQTLHDVSTIYGVRLKSLLKFNHLVATQRIQTGRVLWLKDKRPSDSPVEYKQVPVDRQKSYPQQDSIVAEKMPVDSLQNLVIEPLDKQMVAVGSQTVRDSAADVVDEDLTAVQDYSRLDTTLDEVPQNIKLHVVTPGQTYYAISRLYGVTVKQLYSWNNLSERIPLKIGQELIVDVSEKERISPVKPVIRPRKKPKQDKLVNLYVVSPIKEALYYTVQAGQTVYRIALINKVRVEDLMRWNNLKNYIIEVGQKLLIRK